MKEMDVDIEARKRSLGGLVEAMNEDEATELKSIVLKITATPEGIKVEQQGGEGEVEKEGEKEIETEGDMDNADAFSMLLKKKKAGE